MKLDGDNREKVTLVTLGPTGTCHERAAIEYMSFQGVEDIEVELIGGFFDGLERIRGKDNDWAEIVDVQSKPIVAAELLAGRYEAGLTYLEHLAAHPGELRPVEEMGELDTTWVVYGKRTRFQGDVIGIPSRDLFRAREVAVS